MRIAIAVHKTNKEEWVAAIKAMAAELDDHDPVAIQYWMIYLLRHFSFVALDIGRKPTLQELESLADCLLPRWKQMTPADRRWLVNTLATVWEIDAGPPAVEYEYLGICVSLAMGLLIANPAVDLSRVRPDLAEWWAKNEAECRASARPSPYRW